jgi:hypothetical protein
MQQAADSDVLSSIEHGARPRREALPGLEIEMHIRFAAVLALLLGNLALAPTAAAADPWIVSARLSPVVENPEAGPHGRGIAALTISADRTQLTYSITYREVGAPITEVDFCAGQKPRVVPITGPCAFAISPSPGGSSPITGSRSIEATQADTLLSGYAVIQLSSAAGAQLVGYLDIGPPPPDTATATSAGSQLAPERSIVPVVAALLAFVVFVSRSRRRDVVPETITG